MLVRHHFNVGLLRLEILAAVELDSMVGEDLLHEEVEEVHLALAQLQEEEVGCCAHTIRPETECLVFTW